MRRPDDGQNFSIYFVQEEEVTVFLLKQGLMFWMRKLKLGTAKDGEKDVSAQATRIETSLMLKMTPPFLSQILNFLAVYLDHLHHRHR